MRPLLTTALVLAVGFCFVGPVIAVSPTVTMQAPPQIVVQPIKPQATPANQGPVFVAIGELAKTYYSTDNGKTWTVNSKYSTQVHYAAAYGAGRFIMAGSGGDAGFSPDGKGWQYLSFPSGTYRGITYANGHFVAVSESGQIAYSADGGITWNNSTYQPKSGDDFRGIAYGNGRFVVVGKENRVLYSSNNGKDWTEVQISFFLLKDVAFGGNRFVAVGSTAYNNAGKAVVIVSSDGVNWVTGDSGITTYLDTVVYDANANRFIAGGQSGVIVTSDNLGATWTKRNSGTTNTINDIICGNGYLLAGGTLTGTGGSYISYSTNSGLTWTAIQPGLTTIYGFAFRP